MDVENATVHRFPALFFARNEHVSGVIPGIMEATQATAGPQAAAFLLAPAKPPLQWMQHVRMQASASPGKLVMRARADDTTSRTAWPRRALLSALTTLAVVSSIPAQANTGSADTGKVWGAAELDFRMYVCGATGKFCPSMTKTVVPPARRVDEELADAITEIPSRVLQDTFSKRGKLLPAKLEEATGVLSASLLPAFQRRVAFDSEDRSLCFALSIPSASRDWSVGALPVFWNSFLGNNPYVMGHFGHRQGRPVRVGL